MSMYNLIHGSNPEGSLIVQFVQLREPFDVGRYRDAWVEIEGDQPIIRIHTRNGGGNRECYCDDYQRDHALYTGCTAAANESMVAHPWYLRDADDDFDYTYADFYFKPDYDWLMAYRAEEDGVVLEGRDIIAALTKLAGPHVDVGARWQEAVAQIESGERPVPPEMVGVLQQIDESFRRGS